MIHPKSDKDYLDFINSRSATPSNEISERVMSFVQTDLNPTHKVVFSKLLGIQALIGFLTLTFCPQFNFSLTNSYEVFHYFHHRFGESICMVICGSIFIGSGALFAAYLLKSSEVRKIKQSSFLYYTSISIMALSSFMLLGSEVYLTLAAYWFAGSTIGGVIVFELNRLIRRKLLNY